MRELIKIGNAVDDGQGDYLRKGGEKINNNFSELYTKLGDGETPHASGAWKTHKDTVLRPKFGDAWAINTTDNAVAVELPKGGVADYNKTIKLRDVWRTWSRNPVTLKPAQGDTIKGSPTDRILSKDFMDIELVYCSLGRWEYVENKRIDTISTSDLSTVAKKTFIATDGQTDFLDIFGTNLYNINNVEVYYRGNLLYYGEELSDNSDYGSVGTGADLVALDGHSIRLRFPCQEGDTVQIVTYMDGIASFRSSYMSHTIRVYNTGDTNLESVAGETWVGDLSQKTVFTNAELGISPRDIVNPNTFELMLNGRQLVRGGQADYPTFHCEGGFGNTPEECAVNGGTWVNSGVDYSLEINDMTELVEGVRIAGKLESGDVIFIRWFNNDIGSLLEWDGDDGIRARSDKLYMNTEQVVNLTGRVYYTDYQNPSQKTMRQIPEAFTGRVPDIATLFDLFHPIGTIYENAHNPANPRDYMGFGTWVRYGEGEFLAGWSSNAGAPHFAMNNNDLDASGQPSHTAGGTGGAVSQQITKTMVPELQTTEKVLVKDDNGTVIIGGCQVDPDAQGPAFTKYREDIVKVNQGNVNPEQLSIVPPYRTVHRWLRVA